MLLEKTYIPVHESGSKNLMRKFRDAGLKGEDTIDGFNAFTGIFDNNALAFWTAALDLPIQLGPKEWDKLWDDTGIPRPGPLPSGTVALLLIQRPYNNDHGRVEVKALQRASGLLGSTITANFTQGTEPASTIRGETTFTAVVIPRTMQWTFTLEKGTGFTIPDLIARATQQQGLVEGEPQKKVPLATALKRVAGIDTSPEGLGRKLLEVHREHALKGGAFEECAALVNKGADLTLRDQWGQTIFMKAAGHGHVSLTKLLIEKGADIDALSTKTGSTGRQMAQEVIDNINSKGTLNSHLVESLARYRAVTTLIDETQAARNPAVAVPAAAAAAEDTGPVKVRRPLTFKKPQGS
ncbi:MAG: ankyrin repeat domain-containing protein [Alphaproteobacteria bacterium]